MYNWYKVTVIALPKVMPLLRKHKLILKSALGPIEANIIEVHFTRAAGHGGIAHGAETYRNLVDIGQVDAFVGEDLQVDISLRPFFNQCSIGIIMSDDRAAVKSNIQRISDVIRLASEPERQFADALLGPVTRINQSHLHLRILGGELLSIIIE